MFWRWIFNITLLAVSLWLTNSTLFYWWAAGGPPNPHSEAHVSRGYICFTLAFLCFVAFVVLLLMNIIRYMKRKKEEKR